MQHLGVSTQQLPVYWVAMQAATPPPLFRAEGAAVRSADMECRLASSGAMVHAKRWSVSGYAPVSRQVHA